MFGINDCHKPRKNTKKSYITKKKALLGNIFKYQNFSKYTYENYEEDVKNNRLPRPIVKVWTGR